GLGWGPGEVAIGRDAGARRRPRIEAEGERVAVAVGGRGREGEQAPFVDAPIAVAGHGGRLVDFVDGYRNRFKFGEGGGAVVGDADGDREDAWSLGFGRGPGKDARRGNAGAGRGTRIEAEGQAVGGKVGVGRRRGKGEQAAFVDRLVADRRENRGHVDF